MLNQTKNFLDDNSLYKLGNSFSDSIPTSSINLNKLLPNETCSDFGFQKGKIYEIYGTIDSSRLSLITDIICNCINKFKKGVLYLNSSYQIPQESLMNLLHDRSMINKINSIRLIGNGIGMLHQIIKQELLENDESKDYKLIIVNDLPSLVYHETMNTDRRTIRNRKVLRTLNKNIKERRRYGCKFRLTKYERSLKYGTKRFYNHTLNSLNIDQALQANKDQNLFHLFQSLKKYLAKNQDCSIILTGVLGTKVTELFKTKVISFPENFDSNEEMNHVSSNRRLIRENESKRNKITGNFNHQARKEVNENQLNLTEENTSADDDDEVFGSTFDDYELPAKALTEQLMDGSQKLDENSHTMVYNNVLIDTNKFIPTTIIDKELDKTRNEEEVDFVVSENFDEIDIELGNNYYDDFEIEMNNAESLDYCNFSSETDGSPEERETEKSFDPDSPVNKTDYIAARMAVEENCPNATLDQYHRIGSDLMETSTLRKTIRIHPNAHNYHQQIIEQKYENMKCDEIFDNSFNQNEESKIFDTVKCKTSKAYVNKDKQKGKKKKLSRAKKYKATYQKGHFQIVKSDEAKPIKRKQLVPLHGQNPLWYEFVDSRIILYKDWLVQPASSNLSKTLFCRDLNRAIERTKQQMPIKLIGTDYAMVEKRCFKNYPLTNCDINLFMTEEQIKLNIVKRLCFFHSENGKIFDIKVSRFRTTETKFWKELEKKIVEPTIKKLDLENFELDDFKNLLMNIKSKKCPEKLCPERDNENTRNCESRIPKLKLTNYGHCRLDSEMVKKSKPSLQYKIAERSHSHSGSPEKKNVENKNYKPDESSQDEKTKIICKNRKKQKNEVRNDANDIICPSPPIFADKRKNDKQPILSKKRIIEETNANYIDDVEYNFLRSLKKTRNSTPSSYSYLDDLPSQTLDDSKRKILKFGRKLIGIYHDNRLPQFEDYENFDEYESENSADEVILESQVNIDTIEDSQQFDNDSDKLILPDAEYYKTIQRIRTNLQYQVSNEKLIRVLNKIGKQSDFEDLTTK